MDSAGDAVINTRSNDPTNKLNLTMFSNSSGHKWVMLSPQYPFSKACGSKQEH